MKIDVYKKMLNVGHRGPEKNLQGNLDLKHQAIL